MAQSFSPVLRSQWLALLLLGLLSDGAGVGKAFVSAPDSSYLSGRNKLNQSEGAVTKGPWRSETALEVRIAAIKSAAKRVGDSWGEGQGRGLRRRLEEDGRQGVLARPVSLPATEEESPKQTVLQPGAPGTHELKEADAPAGQTPGVMAILSETGLKYAKDVIVSKVLQELVPLQVEDMAITMSTPVGDIQVNLTDIVLWNASVPDSALLLDATGDSVTVYVGDAAANISATWSFVLGHLWGDTGNASVTVGGLHVVAVGNVTESGGALLVGLEEIGCAIEHLQIDLHSPYSWIYNWLEARLPNHLRSAVQAQVEWSISIIVDELNDFLQALPRELAVDCGASLDVTVPSDPRVLTNGLLLQCAGDFVWTGANCSSRWGTWGGSAAAPGVLAGAAQGGISMPRAEDEWFSSEAGGKSADPGEMTTASSRHNMGSRSLSRQTTAGSCNTTQMLSLKVSQQVVDSAVSVYYESGALSLVVRSLPSSFPFQLNTRAWRFVLPSLSRQYPDRDMELALLTPAPPEVSLSRTHGIAAAVQEALFLRVLLDDGPKDVLCIDIGLNFSAVAGLRGNNLTASARVLALSVVIRWSTVGAVPQSVLEGISRAITKVVLVPLLNYRLAQGFPLPSIPGVVLANPTVLYQTGVLEVCSDLIYVGGIFHRVKEII